MVKALTHRFVLILLLSIKYILFYSILQLPPSVKALPYTHIYVRWTTAIIQGEIIQKIKCSHIVQKHTLILTIFFINTLFDPIFSFLLLSSMFSSTLLIACTISVVPVFEYSHHHSPGTTRWPRPSFPSLPLIYVIL